MTFSEYCKNELGYDTKTTFWEDFSIANKFGVEAIKDTFKRAMESWKDNYIYLTELVLVLNHMIWYWHERNETYAEVYNELWEQADAYGCEHLKGEELTYFYNTLD